MGKPPCATVCPRPSALTALDERCTRADFEKHRRYVTLEKASLSKSPSSKKTTWKTCKRPRPTEQPPCMLSSLRQRGPPPPMEPEPAVSRQTPTSESPTHIWLSVVAPNEMESGSKEAKSTCIVLVLALSACMHTHARTHAHTSIYLHIYLHMYMHIHAYIHTYIHTHTRTHTPTHRQINRHTQITRKYYRNCYNPLDFFPTHADGAIYYLNSVCIIMLDSIPCLEVNTTRLKRLRFTYHPYFHGIPFT